MHQCATSYVSVFNKLFAEDNFGTFIRANVVALSI